MSKSIIVITVLILLSCSISSYLSAGEISGTQRLECYENCEDRVAQLKKYSRNGSPQAQTILALSYKSGELLETIDDDLAWKWMRRARNQTYPPALYYISQWHRQGYHTDIDVPRADKYLERSANKNYPPALLDLGILFIKKNDIEEGLRLIEQAAKAGNPKAKQLLKSITPKTKDVAEVTQPIANQPIPINTKQIAHPDDQVLTVIGEQTEPFYIFENIMDEIKELEIYSRRGSTGSRVGDKKCGQPGSGCVVASKEAFEDYFAKRNLGGGGPD
ncbi:MAG: hypothetical protein ACI9IA_002080 [Enterobacterales bacterium]|jgi:hypothetical protein